jgi:anti-sigma regulatory factor (Ser/Thr protein kinase)
MEPSDVGGITVAQLRHDAFVYDSDAEFTDRMVPFIETGLARGESTIAVTTLANCALLRDALGASSERVSFVDRDAWYVHPAKTIAAYDKTLRDCLLGDVPALRVIGEVNFGRTPEEWAQWTAYESILNRAFADQPAWIVCPYDARALPEQIVEDASRTHPHSFAHPDHVGSHYDDPEHVVRALAPRPAALPGMRELTLDAGSRGLREQLLAETTAAGIAPAKADDLILAASEVLANAHRYGDGPPQLRIGLVDEHFVCEISDHGSGLDDPLAGYLPPKPGQLDSAGLWVARQLTTRVDLMSSADGLTVRLWL